MASPNASRDNNINDTSEDQPNPESETTSEDNAEPLSSDPNSCREVDDIPCNSDSAELMYQDENAQHIPDRNFLESQPQPVQQLQLLQEHQLDYQQPQTLEQQQLGILQNFFNQPNQPHHSAQQLLPVSGLSLLMQELDNVYTFGSNQGFYVLPQENEPMESAAASSSQPSLLPQPSPQPRTSSPLQPTSPTMVIPPLSPTPSPPPIAGTDSLSEFDENDEVLLFDLCSSDLSSPDEISDQNESRRNEWTPAIIKSKISSFHFTGNPGIMNVNQTRRYSALECFKLFVDNDMIKLMVDETNRYAQANFIRPGYHSGFLSGWINVTLKEMCQFIGLLIFMSFKPFPEVRHYWSTKRPYLNFIVFRVMTQTRFFRLLHFWHFGNDGSDSRYSKVNPILHRLNENCRKYKEPGRIMYVGKTTVYLRNRYYPPRQDNPRRGSKMLRVMDYDIYTYKIHILSPDTAASRNDEMKTAVIGLLEDLLDRGRLVIFHNLYVPFNLTEELLKRQCHSIGLIRKGARGTPRELVNMPVEDEKLSGFQNKDGISVVKWAVKGNNYTQRKKTFADSPFFGITTCHTLETVPLDKRQSDDENEQPIPRFLRDLSLSERVFEAYDKYSKTSSATNNHLKWYKRIAADLIVNTACINALVLYRQLNKERIKMKHFREKLFRELVDIKFLPYITIEEEDEPEL